MKKRIIILLLSLVSLSGKLVAQPCNLILPTIDVISTVAGSGNCTFTVNMSFEITNNNGNKWQFIHLWDSTSYPGLSYAATPNNTALAGTLINIAINAQGASPTLSSTYPFDAAVSVISPATMPGLQLLKYPGSTSSSDLFVLQNVQFTLPGSCGQAIKLIGESWASQAASGQVMHCNSAAFTLHINDRFVSGFCSSTVPSGTYNFTISTLSPSVSAYYSTYLDNGDGVFNSLTDIAFHSIASASAITITPSTPFNSGALSYPPAYNTVLYANRKIFVLVQSPSQSDRSITEINPCAAIPLYDFGDLPTIGGTTNWASSRANIVGDYNALTMRIDSTVTSNTSAVWAGNKVGARLLGFNACLDGLSPVLSCDSNDDGLQMPVALYGVNNICTVKVNGNMAGMVGYFGLWFDFNNDGNFGNDLDRSGAPAFYSGLGMVGTSGSIPVTVKIPNGTSPAPFKSRLIVSAVPVTSGAYNSTSLMNGEIEDYSAFFVVPLPITLSDFRVEMASCRALVQFRTALEENVDFHSIERSTDGKTWTAIAMEKSKGPDGALYEINDIDPVPGLNYYRIRSVDKDGTFGYSGTAVGYHACGETTEVQIFPNPAHNTLIVRLSEASSGSSVSITDQLGNTVFQQECKGIQTTLPISQLPAGVYSVCVRSGSGNAHYRTIVKK